MCKDCLLSHSLFEQGWWVDVFSEVSEGMNLELQYGMTIRGF